MELNHRYSLVKLPKDTDLVLCLLREELKATKFFNTLMAAGIDDCYYEPHLGTVILACMGFDEVTDKLMEFYLETLAKHSEALEPDNEVIMKEALRMYETLRKFR
ncbi:MAG TPA: hypothetical protein VGK59_02135 [Ohtaekwangia sp.]